MNNSHRISTFIFGFLIPTFIMAGNAPAAAAGAAFLNIPVGARPAALASAYSALASDAYAPTVNPAGLGFLKATQIAAQHLSYLASMNYEFLSAVYSLRPGDGLGIAAQYLNSGSIAGTDQNGNPVSSYSDSFGAYAFSYGHAFGNHLSLGLTGKWIAETLAGVSAHASAADLGTLYRLAPGFALAATLTNLGSKLTFLDSGDPLPLALHVGAAYDKEHWLLSTEGVFPSAGAVGLRVGTEWRPVPDIAIRAGYRTDAAEHLSSLSGLSAGFGLRVWGQELAYAWLPYDDLGNTNYFSLLFTFGRTDARATTESQ